MWPPLPPETRNVHGALRSILLFSSCSALIVLEFVEYGDKMYIYNVKADLACAEHNSWKSRHSNITAIA